MLPLHALIKDRALGRNLLIQSGATFAQPVVSVRQTAAELCDTGVLLLVLLRKFANLCVGLIGERTNAELKRLPKFLGLGHAVLNPCAQILLQIRAH